MNWAYKEISLTYFQNLWKRQYDENVHDMKIFNIISGDVLGVWTNLEKQLNLKRIQLVRVRLTKDNGIYGLLVPNNLINKAKLAVI